MVNDLCLIKEKISRIRKDYQSKNLCNPFFRRSKKEPNKKLNFILFIIALIVIAAITWFFLASPTLMIKEIRVEGLTRFNQSELENCVLKQMEEKTGLVFKQNNLYLLNKEVLKENILSLYNFSDLEIIKKLPGTLILKIFERPYSFIFQQGSDYFYASRDAYVIPEVTVLEEDKGKYLILENKNDLNLIGEREKIKIAEDYLAFIFL